MKDNAASFIGVARHRMTTDGEGVVTLAAFSGCPLRCRYCLNPQCFDPLAQVRSMTPDELYREVKQDELYFLATGGGVTFGGGEPLLYPDFLTAFRRLCGEGWHLCAETSLNVDRVAVEKAAACMDHFVVDVKDVDPAIYKAYTGQDNTRVMDNLCRLCNRVGPERITLRLPLIRGYNDEACRERSEALLRKMGITRFDRFVYRIR